MYLKHSLFLILLTKQKSLHQLSYEVFKRDTNVSLINHLGR